MILSLNTSTRQCSIALLRLDGILVSETVLFEGKGHFNGLMPAIDRLLGDAGRKPKEIKCLAVATGPGSFTGLRVGLSLAKGFCQALHVPIIGVSSLRALAFQIPFTRHPIAPMITSRRGEVFSALFRWRPEQELLRKEEDDCFRLDDLPSRFEKETVFVGNDFLNQGAVLKDRLKSGMRIAPPWCWQLRASSIGAVAVHRLNAGDTDDPGSLVPRYFRPPDIRSNGNPVTGKLSASGH